MSTYGCENCRIRAYATRKPNGIIARFWRWHTGWCPGWKSYQKSLAADLRETPESESSEDDSGSD